MRVTPALATSTQRQRAPPGPRGERATPIPHGTPNSRTYLLAGLMLTAQARTDTHNTHWTMIDGMMPAAPAATATHTLTGTKSDSTHARRTHEPSTKQRRTLPIPLQMPLQLPLLLPRCCNSDTRRSVTDRPCTEQQPSNINTTNNNSIAPRNMTQLSSTHQLHHHCTTNTHACGNLPPYTTTSSLGPRPYAAQTRRPATRTPGPGPPCI